MKTGPCYRCERTITEEDARQFRGLCRDCYHMDFEHTGTLNEPCTHPHCPNQKKYVLGETVITLNYFIKKGWIAKIGTIQSISVSSYPYNIQHFDGSQGLFLKGELRKEPGSTKGRYYEKHSVGY